MKRKIPKILSVSLALVLALSLCLVTAVPALATHTSSADVSFQGAESTVAGEASILDVVVTNEAGSCAINTVKIDFSESDFTVTGPGTEPENWTGAGPVNDVVTYTAAAEAEIAGDTFLTFSPAVTNPLIFGEATVPAVLTTDIGSKAAVEATGDTGWIGYVADSVGIGGNAITVEYVDPFSEDSPLSVSVLVKAITVNLATDEVGSLTSTASEVATAINGDVDAGALVDALVETGHEADVLTALAVPAFTDGISRNVDKDCPVTPTTLTVTSIVPASFEVVAGTDNTVTAGEAFSVIITAKDEAAGAGATETKYAGDHMIGFTYDGDPPDPKTIPTFEVVTFVAGVGTSTSSFILTDVLETDNKIIAIDESSVTGTSDAITINLPALDHFTITGGETSRTAGVAFSNDVIVTAYDSLDNIKTDYTGTVSWTSSDPLAELPDAQALVAGAGTFTAADFTLKTVGEGTQTITVTGGTVSKTSDPITVNPAVASQWTVVAAPTSIRADNVNESTITATVYDQFGNVDTGYSGTATFTASLGDISGDAVNFTNGVATATLTSDEVVGTATILVEDSGTLPDKTVTVTLMAPDLLAEVWVKAVTGDDANAGTASSPVETIQKGINIAAAGGTVNVAAGTYTVSTTITIGKQLTLKGANYGVNAVTGDRGAESIINGAELTGTNPKTVHITGANVILDGFVIVGPNDANSYAVLLEVASTASGGEVRNNIIYTDGNFGILTQASSHSSWVISNNRVSAAGTAVYLAGGEGAQIEGNLITTGGITLTHNVANTTIQNNTLSNDTGRGVSIALDADGIIITGNTFSGNKNAGVEIWAGATKVSTYEIHQNNFALHATDKLNGVLNGTPSPVDATNNWWGAVSGPTHASNPDGTGEAISDLVVYTPYLDAPYSAPVAPFTTIDLEVGWNFISVPKSMAAATDTFGELLTGIDVEVAYSYDPASGWSSAKLDADPVEVLEGYWIDVNTAGTVTLSYKEAAQEVPASKSLVGDAWNAIGFSKTTALDADTALMSVYGSWSTLLGWDAEGQAYEDSIIVGTTGNMLPGKGYWIWMTEDDVLSAISG